MIIQLRGASGSGKTWVVQQLMKQYKFNPVKDRKNEIKGYYCKELNLFLVGKYETPTGGCDTINQNSQNRICKRIEKATSRGWNVLFEGLICSHIAARYADLYKRMTDDGIRVKYIFLDTTLEKCRQNINARRAKKGKPPVQAKNTEKDYTSTHRSRENMKNMGVPSKDMPLLSSGEAYHHILKWLKKTQ